MGIIELADALGVNKSQTSRYVKKGMPTGSFSAAEDWRRLNVRPINIKNAPVKIRTPIVLLNTEPARKKLPPAPNVKGVSAPELESDSSENNDLSQSLRRARVAELTGYNQLVKMQRNEEASVEDYRKANLIYISARANRVKAERDFRDWQRAELITLFTDEARELVSRPHIACKHMIDVMPKTMAPRVHGLPQKDIESFLVDWCDQLTTAIRKGI